MNRKRTILAAAGAACLLGWPVSAQAAERWKTHDMTRPVPRKVESHIKLPMPPPSDAVVLFDGLDLSNWRAADGGPAKWAVESGNLVAVPGGGPIFTRGGFGDIQLHLEWAAPTPSQGTGQGRGNSGVFLMGKYEIQVLDSHTNVTYADGQAAAVYGQYPPLVNASRTAGDWQSFDIVFRRPRFRPDGSVLEAARITLFHNGVLVQDNAQVWGPTSWLQHLPYDSHPDRMPLSLQDHDNPVLYRNIWLRELDEEPHRGPDHDTTKPLVTIAPAMLDHYVGEYRQESGDPIRISREEDSLYVSFGLLPPIELLPHCKQEFSLRRAAGTVMFDLDGSGRAQRLTFHLGGDGYPASRIPD